MKRQGFRDRRPKAFEIYDAVVWSDDGVPE
jgi:hypothetical protein